MALYDVENPEQYLAALEEDWRREKLLEIRELIFEVAPDIEESINYKMLGYGKGDDYAFHLNVQSAYVSFYVGNIDKVDPKGTMLSGVNRGKGCVRFKKSVNVADTGLKAFIAEAVKRWKRGDDIGC